MLMLRGFVQSEARRCDLWSRFSQPPVCRSDQVQNRIAGRARIASGNRCLYHIVVH